MYRYFYLLHFKFLIIGLRIGRERSIGRGVHNFLLNDIKRWQRTTEECAIYAEYTQKKTGLVSKWFKVNPLVYDYIVDMKNILPEDSLLFLGIKYSANLNSYLTSLIEDAVSFKDLKTARASICTDRLFSQLDLIFVRDNCDIHDKEKGFREAIEYIKDYLFHGTVEISMIYYIDPRLLIRFVTKHNLNPFNCFYSLKLWRFQLWSIPWIVNRNLEIL